jgi:secernin
VDRREAIVKRGERATMRETSCDTLVVLGRHTRDGHTLFAKNSDRPPDECQPLFRAPRLAHPAGALLRCQYVDVPQVSETFAVLGSRPWWLWGFEHGVNELRVAIGNEALHTREEPEVTGLLGMDLVRLGLERGRTAAEAKLVITTLLERHGQGGSASQRGTRRYHNSFIIADPAEAWVLETSGRHWVARRVRDRAAISNCATVEDDWDEASAGIEAYAQARGWWPSSGRRLNFREAFEDPAARYRAEARLAASCRFLAGATPPTVAGMMRHLRDHHEGGTIPVRGRKDGDPLGWSVCMHPDPGVSATAASLVAELPRDPAVPPALWCSQGTPCTSVFLPVGLDAPLPAALTAGGGEPDPVSSWWVQKALGDAAMVDPARLVPIVQRAWATWEGELVAESARDRAGAGPRLEARVAAMLERGRALRAEVEAGRAIMAEVEAG